MWGPVINPCSIFIHLNVDLSIFLSFVISSNIQILMNERALCKKRKKKYHWSLLLVLNLLKASSLSLSKG